MGLIINSKAVGLGKVERRQLHGREWLVAPAVALREGVYAGSEGPIFYPGAENVKHASSWNHMPIVLNHPQHPVTGQFISAASPGVLEERQLGMVLNARGEGGALKLETWFDPDRLAAVAPAVLEALEKGDKPIEVSTGLHLDRLPKGGTHNGMVYNTTATGYKPDHLAVLLHQPGACSCKDGCGILVNTGALVGKLAAMSDPAMVANADSFGEISGWVRDALYADPMMKDYADIEAVFPKYFIFYFKGKFYRQSYTVVKQGVKLEGQYEMMTRRVVYEPAAPVVGNTGKGDTKVTKAADDQKKPTKEELVAALVANGQFEEADKPWLEGLEETQLTKMQPPAAKPAPAPAPAAAPVANAAPAPAAAPAAAPAGGTDWRTLLPADVLSVVDDALVTNQQVRADLVGKITANQANTFTPEQLQAMPTRALPGIAALATPVAAPAPVQPFGAYDYRGQAAPVANAASKPAERKPLGMPTTL